MWTHNYVKSPNWGSMLATSGGLVFTGSVEGKFIALDENTGLEAVVVFVAAHHVQRHAQLRREAFALARNQLAALLGQGVARTIGSGIVISLATISS